MFVLLAVLIRNCMSILIRTKYKPVLCSLTTVWEELRIWGEPDLVLDFGATVMNGTIIGNSHVLMFQWYKTSLTIFTLSLCSEVTDL